MAINLFRSPRDTARLLLDKTANSEEIYPGKYQADNTASRKNVEESAVPFQSLQVKRPVDRGMSAKTPGPGSYRHPEAIEYLKKKKGSHAFRSRSARIAPQTSGSTEFFHASLVFNPGPGSYKAHVKWHTKEPIRPPKGLPVLELSKTAASIPNMRSAVVIEDDGTKAPVPDAKGGIIDDFFEFGSKQIRATNFHVSSSNRRLFEPTCAIENELPAKNNPGPGAYSHHRRGHSAPSGFRSVFASKTPMCHQRIAEEKAEADASVDVSKPLGEGVPNANCIFGSQVRRVGWTRSLEVPFCDPTTIIVPGPGYYHTAEDIEGMEPVKKKIHGVHHPNITIALNETTGPLHAFNTTDIRDCNKPTVGHDHPAPGQYDLDQVIGASMNADIQEKALVGKKGVFGTTADRFFRSHFDQSKLAFGSTQGVDTRNYDLEQRCDKDDMPKRSMVFSSGTKRFSEDGEENTGQLLISQQPTPGPTYYTPDKDVNYRSPFRHPRTEHLSFGSGRPRFDPKDVFVGKQFSTQPGPGEYHSRVYINAIGGSKVRAKRMQSESLGCTNTTVGPGTYELSGTMLRKSFNVT